MVQVVKSAGDGTSSGSEEQTGPAAASSNAEADELWESFLRTEPLLPKDSCYTIDRKEHSRAIGQARRLTLRSAEFPGRYHLDVANRDRQGAKVIAMSMLMAETWRDHLKALHELAEAQALRLRLALMELPDMEQVIAEADADREEPEDLNA